MSDAPWKEMLGELRRIRTESARSEHELFQAMRGLFADRAVLLISHRFSTVRHADRICVLEHGRVVELGTHDELMTLGARYRTMFDLQAQRWQSL